MNRDWFRGLLSGIILTVVSFSGMFVFANGGASATIDVFLNYINIEMDGAKLAEAGQSFQLEDGSERPYSILYEGTTYLPIRKVSEMIGKELSWDDDTKTVRLGSPVIGSNGPALVADTKVKKTLADFFYKYAGLGKSIDDMYVTRTLTVGNEADVRPGIYDITALGGLGKINIVSKKDNMQAVNSWDLHYDSKDEVNYRPSTVRVVLMPEDVIEFDNISKVKFTAIAQDVSPTQELKYGDYIVGRDIKPGRYKLDTNLKFNSEFDQLGYELEIYNSDTGKLRKQRYNYSSPDVRVELDDNEIITVKMNLASEKDADDVSLKFTELE